MNIRDKYSILTGASAWLLKRLLDNTCCIFSSGKPGPLKLYTEPCIFWQASIHFCLSWHSFFKACLYQLGVKESTLEGSLFKRCYQSQREEKNHPELGCSEEVTLFATKQSRLKIPDRFILHWISQKLKYNLATVSISFIFTKQTNKQQQNTTTQLRN